VLWLEVEQFLKGLDGLGEAALVAEHHAEVVERVGIAGILREQGAEDGFGTGSIALAKEADGVPKQLSGGIAAPGLPSHGDDAIPHNDCGGTPELFEALAVKLLNGGGQHGGITAQEIGIDWESSEVEIGERKLERKGCHGFRFEKSQR
jgi:hypothetical protein